MTIQGKFVHGYCQQKGLNTNILSVAQKWRKFGAN
jgi:hypothetical protein